MLQISTSNFSSRKQVEIDGHHYTLRRMGAGDQLDLQRITRQVIALEKKTSANNYVEKAADRNELDRLSQELLGVYIKLFDDHEDGSKAEKLVSSLSYTELAELFNQVFASDKPANSDEATDGTAEPNPTDES